MNPKRKKLLLKILILILLFLIFLAIFELRIKENMKDFEVCYRAGKRFIRGELLYQLRDGHYQFKYPPFYACLIAPLSLLPLPFAKLIWFYLVLIFLSLILYISYVLVSEKRKKWTLLIIPTLLILSKFYGRELDLGQVNSALILCSLLMLHFILKEKEKQAGAFLGLAVTIKPYALIFFPYLLLKRKWKTLIYSTLFLLIAFFIPALRYGLKGNMELLKSWKYTLSISTPKLFNSQDNISFFGFFSKWFNNNLQLVYLFSFLSIFIFSLFLLIAIGQKSSYKREEFLIENSILLIFIPLFSPLGWDYIFLSSTLGIMILLFFLDQFRKFQRYFLILNFIIIGASLYDLMGRELYSKFMNLSILTLNFIFLIIYLLILRFKISD